ncbi:MAG: PQQ-binding-like beta-propeller repeat protein [Planctomycetes bacterium]|nr:PQQ-binding-like beta-propeller repeat protein [Planctomycetota bacterium]
MESIDSELIELLERKAPEHLTIEEIEQLSARLDKSPELQMFLLEQLQMEQYLAAALSRIDVRVDEIIAGRRTSATAPAQGPLKFGLAAALMVLVCGLVAAGGVVWYRAGRGAPREVVVGKPGSADKPAAQEKKQINGVAGAPGGEKRVAVKANESAKGAKGDESVKGAAESAKGENGTNGEKGEGPKKQGADAPRSPVVEAKVKTSPWEASLAAAPRPWQAVVLAEPPSRGMALSGAEAAQWLEPAGAMSKLRAPWPADAMLRLRVPLRGSCELRLWKGNEGAVFHLAGNAGWSSYHALREGAVPQGEPKVRELWETDDGLYWKFHSVEITDFKKARGRIHFNRKIHPNDTTVDLFWHDGVVQLWRGDLRLCSAPLPGPPDEVYLKQDGQLEHLSMVRMEKPPAQPRYVPALALDSAQPAALAWNRQATAPATIENVADGGLKITAPEGAQSARASVALPTPGICDVIFKVQGATNGTGVYLGGADGAPIGGVQLVETATPEHSDLALTAPWEGAPAAPVAAAAAPQPIWARLLVASGALKCWQSRDGRHWAYLGAKPLPAGAPPISTYGVYAAAGAKPARTITLRQVLVRDYSGLNSLAPPELLTRAPAVPSPNAAAWKQSAAQSLPGGVDRGAWHRAVALRTIASGAPQEVCSWLLRALLTDAGKLPRSVEQNRRLLAEFPDVAQMTVAVLPWDGRSPQPMLADLVAAAGEFADAAQSEGETRPFTTLGRQVVAARMGAFPELNYEFPDNLVLPELMQLAAAERYDEMEQTARIAQLYARDESASAAQWALEQVAQQRRGNAAAASGLAAGGSNPLAIETSKAQRMFMEDLLGAVRGGQWPHASQMITHLEPAGRLEMFADPKDPMVWVTPATQISALLEEYPLLAAQMKKSFADKGRLRVRFAIADNDTNKVMHAATQFAGTSAATEAYQWIGDEVLQGGNAVGALAWYGKALQAADVAQRDQLAARLRLVHAMLGRDFGSAPRFTVRLKDREHSAEEFEGLVQAARKNAQAAVEAAPLQTPPAAGFRIEPLPVAPADRPWIGEGLALSASGATLLAQDGRTVAAWDLAGNKVRWQRPLGAGGGVTWLPQIGGRSVVVTARSGGGAQLHRLDLDSGEPLGKPAAIEGACFSGFAPPVSGNSALGLGSRPINNKPTLVLSAVDLATGQSIRDTPLLPRSKDGTENCPPLATADALLVFVDGGIVCCETAGVIRWIRRQHMSGAKSDATGALPTQSLAVEGDAIAWQRRVPYIERIDLAHGRRKWLRMLPEIRRIIGILDGRVIVEANERVVALSAADGKVLWNKPLGELLAPAAVGSSGGILVTRAKVVRAADPNQPNSHPLVCPELVWLDPASGQMRGVWPLEGLAAEHLALGPWVVSQGTIITFFGAGKTNERGGVQWDAARQLLRLTPQGGPQPPREDAGSSIW